MKNIIKKIFIILLIISVVTLCIILSMLSFHIVRFFIINEDTKEANLNIEMPSYVNLNGKSYNKNTKELELSNITVDTNFIMALYDFTNLEKVAIKDQIISLESLSILKKIFPNINFKYNIELLGKKVPNDIDSLDYSKVVIKDLTTFKQSLKFLDNLKYLDLSDCNLSNEELANLREEFPNIKIVWRVHLGKWSLKTDCISFSVLITRFDYKRMTSKDIQVLKYCTDLQALDLGHQSITDISVIGDYLPNLRLLILADNQISDITPIRKLKHLHYLELFMNNIKDISPLVSCTEMVDLNLAHIGPLRDFSPIINNKFPLLERLCIQNSGGTSKYYNSIKNTYPNVKIVHTGYGSTHSGWRTHPRYYAMIDMFNKRNYISELFTRYDNM